MRVTYVTRSFLDYRIPVLESLHKQLDGQFRIIYSADYVPERCHARLQKSLGEAAIGLRGEYRVGSNKTADYFANKAVRFVYQPGIWGAIKRARPDVLVGDGFFQWTSFCIVHRIFNRVGLVVAYERTFHTEREAQRIRKAYRRGVMRFVDAMAVNGSLSKEYSVSLGMPEERITVGQMTADAHVLAERSSAVSDAEIKEIRHLWGSPDVAMVAVGRLNEPKGIHKLLDAWSLLEQRKPGNWRLVIIGDGPDRSDLEEQAQRLELRRIVFAGHVDYDGIARLYAAADALVMPTLEDNWSLVVPEAMACGLPVLCSVYNGCYPELIEPDGNGWIFDPLKPEGTFAALLCCVERRHGLSDMGQRSRVIVSDFTPEHAADAILEACRMAQARACGGARSR